MNWTVIAISVAISMPAVLALAAVIFHTTRYVRLLSRRKITWLDYVHAFSGGWTRLITPVDQPDERRCVRKIMVAAAFLLVYMSFLIALSVILEALRA